MEFNSLTLQGSIISSEILSRIRSEEEKFQTASHFGLESRVAVRDEIGLAWADARRFWAAFQSRRERLRPGESGQTDTRKYWLIPLLGVLGYELTAAPPHVEPDTGRSFPISHRDDSRHGLPIHLVGIGDSLDSKSERGRLSPHGLTQEYLNSSEHTYALLSNGALLRLLRDSSRLTRLSFLEFNLEKMMAEELYADFALLYRLLHATRMPTSPELMEESYIEHYHVESLSSGARIRERLSRAVENSLKELGNGLLRSPQNSLLREGADDGSISASTYYHELLRLVYRILFLIVIEERNLVFTESKGADFKRFRDIYHRYYSLARLRRLAEHHRLIDGNKYDLWQSLMATFRLFEDGDYASRIGMKPLGTGIFAPRALEHLRDYHLPNAVMLRILRNLSFFENAQGQPVRVNYGDLDVEEFGSVYEGLLEYEPVFVGVNGSREFHFKEGSDRSSSGSHYTPEELVKPLITHSLDHLIAEKMRESDPEAGLLSLRVADIACGSGHILLSAARRIGFKLACLREARAMRLIHPVEQPSPTYLRAAIRDVISHCIYGVDRNPMAVELCKVALWLEAHNPGEPLGFLDHHIKCGDAIVGLGHSVDLRLGIQDESFAALHGDDKELATRLKKQNKRERGIRGQQSIAFGGSQDEQLAAFLTQYREMEQMPENHPDEIAAKQRRFLDLSESEAFAHLRLLADVQMAQFFIPKQAEHRAALVTDEEYFRMFHGTLRPSAALREQIAAVSKERRFFHWFLEFPEVFGRGGFDCILGNPPFLGGLRITTRLGDSYYQAIRSHFPNSTGKTTDLVAYFFLRGYNILANNRFLGMIATITISNGDTRRSAIEYLVENGSIIYALRSINWPGEAAVRVSQISAVKGRWNAPRWLDGQKAENINAYLTSEEGSTIPFELEENSVKCYKGVNVFGIGFSMTIEEKDRYLKEDPNNALAIQEYITGKDLNQNPNQAGSRFIINFQDWAEGICRQQFPQLFEQVRALVLPLRMASNDQWSKTHWWQFCARRQELYHTLESKRQAITACITSRHLAFSILQIEQKLPIFDIGINVFPDGGQDQFAVLQSSIHSEWAWKYGSRMKQDLRYSQIDCIRNFPFPHPNPEIEAVLSAIGEAYHEFRRQLMLDMQWGLTKTYNLFHSKHLRVASEEEMGLDDKRFGKALGKDGLALRKHLHKTGVSIEFNEVVARIQRLRAMHVEMDKTVAAAYGWGDVDLGHGFHEVDYLPEEDRVRFTLHPDARKEILARLLKLNHERHAAEAGNQPTLKEKHAHEETPKSPRKSKRGTLSSEEFNKLLDDLSRTKF